MLRTCQMWHRKKLELYRVNNSSFPRTVTLMPYFREDFSCFYSSTLTPSSSRLLRPSGTPVTALIVAPYCFKLAGVAPEQHSITMETIPLLRDWPLVNKEVRAADWCLPLLKVVTAVVVTTSCQRDKKYTPPFLPHTGSPSTPQPFINHFY